MVSIRLTDFEQETKRRIPLATVACGLNNAAPDFSVFDGFVKSLKGVERATVAAFSDSMRRRPSQLHVFGIIPHDVC